ncbi:hypothetical protein ACHAPC_010307 [Botrytis cinerea]
MSCQAYKRVKYEEKEDAKATIQLEAKARGYGVAFRQPGWPRTIIQVTILGRSFTRAFTRSKERSLHKMEQKVAKRALYHLRQLPLLPPTLPPHPRPPRADPLSAICGPVYSEIPHGGPLARFCPSYGWPSILGKRKRDEKDEPVYTAGTNAYAVTGFIDELKLSDKEKQTTEVNLKPNLDPLRLLTSQQFKGGMEHALSLLLVATFRRIENPTERQEFLDRCMARTSKMDPTLF